MIRFVMVGDNKSAVKAMGEVAKASDKTGVALDKTGVKSEHAATKIDLVEEATSHLRSALTYAAGAAGLGSLYFGLKDAIDVSSEFQTRQTSLTAALRASGLSVASSLAQINEATEHSALHGGYKAVDQTGAITQFVAKTHSVTKALQLNTEATEIGRAGNISYASAVQLIAQAQNGHIGRLQKLLPNLQPITANTEKWTAAMKKQSPEMYKQAQGLDRTATATEINAAILKQYAGETEAYSHTAAGALSNAQHAFEALAETVAKVVLPYVAEAANQLNHVAQVVLKDWPAMSRDVKDVTHWFREHKNVTDALLYVITATAGGFVAYGIALKAVAAAEVIYKVATFGATLATTDLDAAVMALGFAFDANPIGATIVALTALAAATIYAYHHFKTFRTVVNDVVGFVSKHWELLVGVISAPLAPIIETIKHLHEVEKLVGHITGGGAAHAVGHFVTHPFGLASGGIVPGFATGGFVGQGTDTVPAMLTEGEAVLRKTTVDVLGTATVQRINETGQLPETPGGGAPIHFHLNVDGRQFAEIVMHQQRKAKARS